MGWKQHNRHYAYTQCIRWTYSDPFTPYFLLELLTPTGVILHGDFGALFKAVRGGAEEVETTDSFAIKTNSTDLSIDNAPAMNMKRANDWLHEISLLKEIVHSNIIRLRAVYATDPGFENPNSLYLVMERVQCTLWDAISEEESPYRLETHEKRKRAWKELLLGVEFLHRHRITHRDLNGDNCGFQYSAHGYTLKILGLSKAQCEPLRPVPANEEETNLSSEAEADDLFDVGQIIVETITGRPFFDVSDPAQRERKEQLRRFGPPEGGESAQQPGPSHRSVPSDPLNLENLLPSNEFPDRPSKRRTMDLVYGLTNNPKRRCSAVQALQIVPEMELPYPLEEEFHGRLEDLEHIDQLSIGACIQRINNIIKDMSGLLDDFVQRPHPE